MKQKVNQFDLIKCVSELFLKTYQIFKMVINIDSYLLEVQNNIYLLEN
jgi:hypothetical protein